MSDPVLNSDFYKSSVSVMIPFDNLPVPGASCGHSLRYQTDWETRFCGLCFLREGYQNELPGRLHVTKQLADNGNPQQTGSFQSHVRVSERLISPEKGESMYQFRGRIGRPREEKGLRTPFPFADSLWHVASRQPPLAQPLLMNVLSGRSEAWIASVMVVSRLNIIDRLGKAVNMATNYIRAYHG